jgi:hypothetical protein
VRGFHAGSSQLDDGDLDVGIGGGSWGGCGEQRNRHSSINKGRIIKIWKIGAAGGTIYVVCNRVC